MAKVQIKSEKITPFGGIFHVREHFSRFVGLVIYKVLRLLCTSFGYQYSQGQARVRGQVLEPSIYNWEMARTARTHSDSGVYHVILRGVNKQQIFECTEDYQRFLNILRTLTVREQDESGHRSKPNCVVYAYCLMGNHVHLLIKESSETLTQIMKRISSSYVYYYNHK